MLKVAEVMHPQGPGAGRVGCRGAASLEAPAWHPNRAPEPDFSRYREDR